MDDLAHSAKVSRSRELLLLVPVGLVVAGLAGALYAPSIPNRMGGEEGVWVGLPLMIALTVVSIVMALAGLAWLFVVLLRRGSASDPVTWTLRVLMSAVALYYMVTAVIGIGLGFTGRVDIFVIPLLLSFALSFAALVLIFRPVVLARRRRVGTSESDESTGR
jgi:hypothetical protein